MSDTVIGHVLGRLKQLGVDAVFGVPGDFAFSVQDAIVAEPDLDWVGCCNELNAGYAADGYARMRGIGVLSTTYGVGELSALNAVAGSFAENVPVVHLTGMPAMAVQDAGSLVHHTLGDGDFGHFKRMADSVVCASAVLTPANVVRETDRLLRAALEERRPVYMAFPSDLAGRPIAPGPGVVVQRRASNMEKLEAVRSEISLALEDADTACVLPGILVSRLGFESQVTRFIDATALPFATMFADKAVLDEQHPNFIGMYYGTLMNDGVRAYVEGCDRVIRIGTAMTDFNSGAFTARLDPARVIDIGLHQTKIGDTTYPDVEMTDVLDGLARQHVAVSSAPRPVARAALPDPADDGPITAAALYAMWERFFAAGDIIVAETGTAAMGLAFTRLPSNARIFNQTLWGSIGWATPASFGAAVAHPDRRIILITGEGSHQLTAQEISQFGRRGLRPIVFVLNNGGYVIERLLCRDPATSYNDVATWNYTELPSALGCPEWFTARVTTPAELAAAMDIAAVGDRGCYIEVVTDGHAVPVAAQRLHDNAAKLYGLAVRPDEHRNGRQP